MILGGGIIRSGGRTKYVMFIDMVGTWCFGISLIVFHRRKWMKQLKAS